MQYKIMIFSGMFFGRLKDDDANVEDFFEYTEKYIRDAQDTTSNYTRLCKRVTFFISPMTFSLRS